MYYLKTQGYFSQYRAIDLSFCDFFLWRFIKNAVFARSTTTRNNMKSLIREIIHMICRNISYEVLLRTIDELYMYDCAN